MNVRTFARLRLSTSPNNLPLPKKNMAKIISFGSQKGGVGKSSLTCLCANALSSPPFSYRVAVVDLDKQQSIIKRRLSDQQGIEAMPPYEVHAWTLQQFQDTERGISKLAADVDFIFLDVAGKLDNNLTADKQEIFFFLQYVHFLFIPFVPGNYAMQSNLDYLKGALKVRDGRKKEGRPLDVVGLVNMSEVRTLDDKFLIDEITSLKNMVNIKWMDNALNRYALFRNVDTLESFYDVETKDKAKQNFTTFFDEFLKIISK